MKQGILLAAFGSSNPQGENTLKSFDLRVRTRFDLPLRWAFTSLILRERLAAARIKRDSVRKALQKMSFEKYTHVAVQPLQTIPGSEYMALLEDVQWVMQEYKMKIFVGRPLLSSAEDIDLAARAVLDHLPNERSISEAVVFMGHGAKHEAVKRYEDLAHAVYAKDINVHVGTMNGALTLKQILPKLENCSKVWLMPLLSVIGQHALKDMAGKGKNSWKNRIEHAGHECIPVLHGIAEYTGFIDIWMKHLELTLSEMESACIKSS